MRSHIGATIRLVLTAGLAALALTVPLSGPAQAVTGTPFACVPKFYQVTATNGGSFQQYDAATNSMSRVGTGAVSGINAIGYNPSDNYIYGVSGTKLYRIDSTGSFSTGTTITGTVATSGGDFYQGKLIAAPSSGNAWTSVDVSTATAASYALTGAANGNASSGTWGAYDLTVQGDLAYGLNNQTLYIVKMDTKQISSRTVTGPTNGNYGAAYSDASGNAFFYNNTDNKVFMLSKAALADATGSATAPTAVLVGGAASTPALTAPNDGASCPNAASPYVPTVNDGQTSASGVTDTSATLAGSASANNTSTSVDFCYGTDPTLATCTTVAATPATITGTTPTAFSTTVTGLDACTTYYYRVVASNSVGANNGTIQSFTTTGEGGCSEEPPAAADQTIDFAELAGMTLGDEGQVLSATATSELPVTFTSLTPATCDIEDGTVVPLAAGTCTVAADQPGDSDWNAANRVTRSFVVGLLGQTISFPALPDTVFGGTVGTPAPSSSAGLPVTVASTTPEVCAVHDGSVTALMAGLCTLRATQDGDDTHAAATPVETSFQVARATQSVTIAPVADIKVNAGPAHVVITTSIDITPEVTTLTPAVCTVGAAGTVNLVSAGTCTIAASVAETANYSGASDSTSFTVQPDLVVTQPDPVTTTPDSPISVDLPATSGVGPFTWTFTQSPGDQLPPGLTLDAATGRITGTVKRPGQYEFHVTVTDATGERVVRAVELVVASTLTGHAPSGSRTVVAGGMLTLPDNGDDVVSWQYGLPSSLHVVRTADGRVWLRADAHSSGRYDVPLTISDGVTTIAGTFHVTVLPPRVASGRYRLGKGLSTRLRWAPWPGATSYRVYVGGRLVGRSETPTLSLSRPLGPRDKVTVRTEGADQLLAGARRLAYVAPSRSAAPLGATVYFGTNLSDLDRGARTTLRHLGNAVRSGGFHHVLITGFTDSRGSMTSNLALSQRRATAVDQYLRSWLKGRAVTARGHSELSPAASNATPAGMALNRRVEIRVW